MGGFIHSPPREPGGLRVLATTWERGQGNPDAGGDVRPLTGFSEEGGQSAGPGLPAAHSHHSAPLQKPPVCKQPRGGRQ